VVPQTGVLSPVCRSPTRPVKQWLTGSTAFDIEGPAGTPRKQGESGPSSASVPNDTDVGKALAALAVASDGCLPRRRTVRLWVADAAHGTCGAGQGKAATSSNRFQLENRACSRARLGGSDGRTLFLCTLPRRISSRRNRASARGGDSACPYRVERSRRRIEPDRSGRTSSWRARFGPEPHRQP